MLHSFTCCVGTGMENHALHGDGIYYEAGDRLWVNLYTPSTAEWKAAGVKLSVQTDFPEGEAATINLALHSPHAFTLLLRRPSWAGAGFAVTVNGHPLTLTSGPGSYIAVKRTWKTGDRVALHLPKALHEEPAPDNPHRVALLWGPLVLASDLGPEDQAEGHAELTTVPNFLSAGQAPASWLKPVTGQPGTFRSAGVGRASDQDAPHDVTLVPFYRLHERAYSLYCDLYTPGEWTHRAANIAAEQERQRKLKAATVSFAQPGEMQPERDFHQQGEESYPERVMGRPGRNGRKWFSFDLPVDPTHPLALVITYHGGERRKAATFDIVADGQRLATQEIAKNTPAGFFDVEYKLPLALVTGKSSVTFRFNAHAGSEVATVFGLRVIRADAPR